jgi:hypothetical protein
MEVKHHGEFTGRSAYTVIFAGEIGCMVLKNFGRRGRFRSTIFSCGLHSTRDAGPTTGCTGMDYPMILPASYACSTMRSTTTFLSVVCFQSPNIATHVS